MAQLYSDKISCSICLDLLTHPVTLSCGHSYCKNCIQDHWDKEEEKVVYTCPQCRKMFMQRPVLEKNIMLAELVDDLRNTGLQPPPADHCFAGPEDVACDVCTGKKLKAIQSCLSCPASYCEKHLQPHCDAAPLKKHKLVEPLKNLQENICSCHCEVKTVFCRADQQSICHLCAADEHEGHETVPAAIERAERQKELEASQGILQQVIQEREKDTKILQQQQEAIDRSADEAVEQNENIFDDLIRFYQNKRSAVTQQLRSRQQTDVSAVKELQEKLKQEIEELKRKGDQLEQLSHIEDHNQFLHSYSSASALSQPTASSSIQIVPVRYFEAVTAAVLEVIDKLHNFLAIEWANISVIGTEEVASMSPPEPETEIMAEAETDTEIQAETKKETETEPKTRDDFLKYSLPITLDQNTANTNLLLFDQRRKAMVMKKQQPYTYHPDRFTEDYYQVLSREALTGRCYWEVEWSGKTGVAVAVAYKGISRAGGVQECSFGLNDKSWALICDRTGYGIWHNNIKTIVSGPQSSKVGVYLDHRAGVLSFYSISETMTLLHTVLHNFNEPLYAGFRFSPGPLFYPGDSAAILKLTQ